MAMFQPNDLRDVLAIARAGALGAGARRLRIDASTMGRRLAALEARLGFPLFLRRRAGLAPTAEGTRVIQAAEAQELGQAQLERELRRDDTTLRGELRIATAEWGALLLTPALAGLALSAPALTVTLLVDNRPVDLAAGEADLALRVGRPTQRTLIARRLGPIAYRVYGSGDYLARRGAPAHEAQLAGHDLCELRLASKKLPHLRWQARLIKGRRVALRTTSMLALIEATRASAGLAVLPAALARRYPDLRPVLEPSAAVHNTLWLVFPETLRRSPLIAAVEPIADRVAPLLRA